MNGNIDHYAVLILSAPAPVFPSYTPVSIVSTIRRPSTAVWRARKLRSCVTEAAHAISPRIILLHPEIFYVLLPHAGERTCQLRGREYITYFWVIEMDKKLLEQKALELERIVTHPAFEKMIAEIDAQPADKRFEYTLKVGTIAEFKKRGIPVTDDLKITPRVFEGTKVSADFEASARQGMIIPGTGKDSTLTTYTLCLSALLLTFGVSFSPSMVKPTLGEASHVATKRINIDSKRK